ncbi:MAG TPA: ABC transporter ATP-binding protein [Acetobacteraceae bacterium]|nr:ABC transporter ATP-binding protein [Acetobacteraceae bacterium]
MLAIRSLAARYGRSQVLHDVTLSCAPGEVVCLLGRNGVGKSTTLKSIMGIVSASGGEIRFGEETITGLRPHSVARRGIGYVPEERLIFPDLTVAENLSMGVWRGLGPPARAAFDRVLAVFPRLAERMRQRGRTLSGGEQQMLAIGRALMGEPRLLLVDEPSEGLAPVIVQALERALKTLAESGIAVLVVESKLAVARRIADRITVMSKGETVFDGPPAALAAAAEIRRQYLEV